MPKNPTISQILKELAKQRREVEDHPYSNEPTTSVPLRASTPTFRIEPFRLDFVPGDRYDKVPLYVDYSPEQTKAAMFYVNRNFPDFTVCSLTDADRTQPMLKIQLLTKVRGLCFKHLNIVSIYHKDYSAFADNFTIGYMPEFKTTAPLIYCKDPHFTHDINCYKCCEKVGRASMLRLMYNLSPYERRCIKHVCKKVKEETKEKYQWIMPQEFASFTDEENKQLELSLMCLNEKYEGILGDKKEELPYDDTDREIMGITANMCLSQTILPQLDFD
jgi:hypothetical protein